MKHHHATRLCLSLIFTLCIAHSITAQPYWNNLDTYRLNKVQPHDRIIPDGEKWRINLNGTWQFAHFDSPSALRTPISSIRFTDTIRVPGNVELQGFGVPVYVNMKNEFHSNPPFAPTDYNPTYIYARNFTIPDSWNGRRTVIKFGAVKSAMYLYINGREVGYSEDSKTPAEWDITRYLQPGTNRLVAKVLRWCDGSYLECQDMWRMSGITRDVELYSVPRSYITDLKIIADLDTSDWTTGLLDVMVDLNGEVQGGSIEWQLVGNSLAAKGTKKLDARDWFTSFAYSLPNVNPKGATTPAIYTLAPPYALPILSAVIFRLFFVTSSVPLTYSIS